MLKGDQLYVSEKEVGALCLLCPCVLILPVLTPHGGLTAPLPSSPISFQSKFSTSVGLYPIGSAEKGHPFSRRPELEFEVERASYFMINTFLATTITPLPRCSKSSKCPLLPPSLSWQLAEGRTLFFFATAAEKLCSASSSLPVPLPQAR